MGIPRGNTTNRSCRVFAVSPPLAASRGQPRLPAGKPVRGPLGPALHPSKASEGPEGSSPRPVKALETPGRLAFASLPADKTASLDAVLLQIPEDPRNSPPERCPPIGIPRGNTTNRFSGINSEIRAAMSPPLAAGATSWKTSPGPVGPRSASLQSQ
jgi:hypothetical protein